MVSEPGGFGLNTEVTAVDGRITLTGEVIDNQMYCEMQAQILPTNGTIRTNGDGTITVNNADEATIVLTTGQIMLTTIQLIVVKIHTNKLQ